MKQPKALDEFWNLPILAGGGFAEALVPITAEDRQRGYVVINGKQVRSLEGNHIAVASFKNLEAMHYEADTLMYVRGMDGSTWRLVQHEGVLKRTTR